MTSPWRDLIAYAEFLRDAGNVFVEAPPGKELPVFPPKSPPASFSPAVPHRPVSAPPRHVPAPAAASATRPAVPPRRAAEPMPQPDLHNIVSSRTPLSSVILSELERETKVAEAKEAVASCMACELCKTRTNTVYGSGSLMAKIAFVGEAPGEEEDRQGLPFVGRAGQLLTKMIESIGFKREEVYICNTLKCRPPGNRDPLPHEKQACQPFLIQQLDWIRPQMIVALGAHAGVYLTGLEVSVGKLRKKWHLYHRIPVMVTYHPAFLLRSPGFKMEAFNDLLMLHKKYCELNPGDERTIWQKKNQAPQE